MSKPKENQSASESEIKIEMNFEEAVKITNETYNNYQDADNNLNNLNIQQFQNSGNEKGRFKLYHKFHDINSNFSGMTYIYDDKKANAVNVAIACRGTDIKKCIDLWQDVTMIWRPDTDSDKVAKEYADKILKKIVEEYIVKQIHKYKEINVIFLGHSKGGREAQKQMLVIYGNPIFIKKKILFEYKDKKECTGDCPCKCKEYWQDNCSKKEDCKCNKRVNISTCCLTFNSAPCSKEDNKKYPKQIENCQNLIVFDKANLAADPLTYIKFIFFILLLLIISLILIKEFIIKDEEDWKILLSFYIISTLILLSLKTYKILNWGIIALTIICATIIATIIEICKLPYNIIYIQLALLLLTIVVLFTKLVKLGKNSGNKCGYQVKWTDSLFQAHFISEFSSDSSRYKDLAKTDISKIIKVKQWKELESLADEESKKREPLTNKVNPPKND